MIARPSAIKKFKSIAWTRLIPTILVGFSSECKHLRYIQIKRLNQITINFCYNCLSDLRLSIRSHNTRMIQSNLIHIIPGITYVYWLILHICMIFWCYSSTQNNLESTTLFVLYTKFFCIFKKKLVEMLYIISLAQVNRERSFCSHVFKIMDLTQDWMKEASS